MKRVFSLLACALPLLTASCGYQLGGLVNGKMEGMKTFDITMFENQTTYPHVAMQMTTALADAMQSDGTFKMDSASRCDFTVSGKVKSVQASSLTTNPDDTYLSLEIGLEVLVDYTITNRKTGLTIKSGTVRGKGSYFNTEGNVQSAREAALSYATRMAALVLVDELTLP
ncbi:MAG: hypothetical protein IKV92_06975 [Akkermansia sp.]|nr:hypothetical protein [Akkermansia sp.]MBR5875212.1 hypothetical protein [Akkermansia sp.]